jgi:hypothetical protein
VLSIRHDPFPLEAARDLLGLVRAVYAARAAEGAGAVTRARIAVIGVDLAEAVELGAAHRPGTLGHAAAWKRAERAAAAAADLVALTDGADAIVKAAMGRVR